MSESEPENGESAPSSSSSIGMVTGLFKSLTNLAATLLALAQTRLELLTTELQEEVQRAAGLVVWAFVALLAAMLGLFFAGLTIVLVYWDTHRILVASLVTAALFVFAVIAVLMLVAKAKSRPRFLDATLTELAKDAHSLRNTIRETDQK